MKILVLVFFAALAGGIALWVWSRAAKDEKSEMGHELIDPVLASERSRLEQSFALMRTEGHWNTHAPLLWGYFFINPTRGGLSALATSLQRDGYTLVSIEQSDEEEETDHPFMLHVERVETHTPESLAKRNLSFHSLALNMDVRSYDGWDAGPVQE